ncbi:MAG: phosphoribosyl-ATP diphosphatase [Pseudomonadota bacterium]|nr:phosphoribosyl-ATP diphosphatase [Pseudomonadota bacterium]
MSSKKEYEIKNVLYYLEDLIEKKKKSNKNITYTEKLLAGNINKIIQKVGEETVEVLIEATLKNKQKTIYESADLIFHLLIMWNKLEIKIEDIAEELEKRKK